MRRCCIEPKAMVPCRRRRPSCSVPEASACLGVQHLLKHVSPCCACAARRRRAGARRAPTAAAARPPTTAPCAAGPPPTTPRPAAGPPPMAATGGGPTQWRVACLGAGPPWVYPAGTICFSILKEAESSKSIVWHCRLWCAQWSRHSSLYPHMGCIVMGLELVEREPARTGCLPAQGPGL